MEVTQAKFSSDFRTFFFPAQLKLDQLGSPWSHQNYFRFFATKLTGASITEWFEDTKMDDVTACRDTLILGKKKGSN